MLLVSTEGSLVPLSFKLEFEATNNMVEYEELLLGLKETRNLNIVCLTVYGDSKLVAKKTKNQCHTKCCMLRDYRNEVWDLMDNFFLAFNAQFLPREGNQLVDSLAIAANNFKPPQNPLVKYEVEVRYIPFVPDNVRHW